MLSAAGGNPRDFAILQLFLQTGLRVSELVNLRLVDVDLAGRTIRITGKGNKQRELVLEKKATQALTSYVQSRLSLPARLARTMWFDSLSTGFFRTTDRIATKAL
jgi:site-specific recombinase XerD